MKQYPCNVTFRHAVFKTCLTTASKNKQYPFIVNMSKPKNDFLSFGQSGKRLEAMSDFTTVSGYIREIFSHFLPR